LSLPCGTRACRCYAGWDGENGQVEAASAGAPLTAASFFQPATWGCAGSLESTSETAAQLSWPQVPGLRFLASDSWPRRNFVEPSHRLCRHTFAGGISGISVTDQRRQAIIFRSGGVALFRMGESVVRVGRLQPVITKAAPNFRGVGIFIADVISESGTEQTAKFAAI
jgi:hypothetical protein